MATEDTTTEAPKTKTKTPTSNRTPEHETELKARGIPTGGPETTELPNGGHGGIQPGVVVND